MKTALAALACAAPLAATAYELESTDGGVPLRWPTPVVEVAVARGAAPWSAPLRAAFDAWSQTSSASFEGRFAGTATSAVGRVLLSELPAEIEARGALALTLNRSDASGALLGAELLLNVREHRFDDGPGSFDLRSVLTHEAGHAIGLAHSCGIDGRSPRSCFELDRLSARERERILGAVMAPTLAVGEARRTPNADDEAGERALYPGTRGAALALGAPSYDCEAGGWQLAVDDAWILELRDEAGARSTAPVRARGGGRVVLAPVEGVVDLLARDPATGGLGSRVGLALSAPSCASPDAGVAAPEPPSGCSSAGPAPLWLVLALAALMRRRALALALAAAIATPALAYECTRTEITRGPSLVWPTRTVRWVMGAELTADIADPEDTKAALIASFDAWTAAPCSDLSFELAEIRAGAHAEAPMGGPYENVVSFLSVWPYEPGIIALTTNAYEPTTGKLFDSDIEIDDQHFEFVIAERGCVPIRGRMDLQNTITHEVGHVVGLDHPKMEPQNEDTTMYPSAPPCEIEKRSLADDDLAGICDIYPTGQPNAQCFPPEGPSFTVVSSDDGTGCGATPSSPAALALILLALARARRAR